MDGGGEGDLGVALVRAGRLARRRGFVAVVSDFLDGSTWHRPLRSLAARHDVLAVEVVDPIELELPDLGYVHVVDPETGRRHRLDTSRAVVRRRYAEEAARRRQAIADGMRTAGVDHVRLRTDRDWVVDLATHVIRRRHVRSTLLRGRP
jgi:uncharacterized protein (DUF58 family)